MVGLLDTIGTLYTSLIFYSSFFFFFFSFFSLVIALLALALPFLVYG